MCRAPPRRSSVSTRNVSEPDARSSSHSRCITSWRYGASIRGAVGVLGALDGSCAAHGGLDLPGSDLVQHALDELGLDGDRRARELGEALDGADDRGAGGLAVQAVEPKRVREQAGDATGEAIELRQRVLAERDEHVDAVRRREDGGQHRVERPRAGVVGVVEEVLLRLIEDDVDVALAPAPARAPRAPSRSRRPSPR